MGVNSNGFQWLSTDGRVSVVSLSRASGLGKYYYGIEPPHLLLSLKTSSTAAR